MYYLAAFFAGIIFLAGMIVFRKKIYRLIENTIALLDIILDSQYDDSQKQKLLIQGLGGLLGALAIFILGLVLIVCLSAAPLAAFGFFTGTPYEAWDVGSFYFYAVVGLGSVVPVILFQLTSVKQDYSEWSILLHRIALDRYNLQRYLFKEEQRWFKRKLVPVQQTFVIISGLARAGTTALTTVLHESGKFHSLSYANMPFLLSPNLWAKLYAPKSGDLRERSHGDKVMFGYNSVEALEEFFWKAHLNDAYRVGDVLQPHEVKEKTYHQYLAYQHLLKGKQPNETIYLAKNNNFILRYPSLRKWNKDFRVIFLFRDPIEHAHSLLNQHTRYKKFQTEDSFILEYMTWLGHHEFGINHKKFSLGSTETVGYESTSLNYWVACWIEYYTALQELIKDDPGAILLDYQDFARRPAAVLGMLERELDVTLSIKSSDSFEGVSRKGFGVDDKLKSQSLIVYNQLLALKKVI